MSSQLAFETSNFFERINQFIDSPKSLPLIQLKKEALQCSQFNDVDGYLARTVLAGLDGNLNAIHSNYQQAITSFSNQHAFSLAVYAKSLMLFGLFSRAADLMHKAFELSPTTLNYLDDAIYFYGLAGHFHQVEKLLKIWDKQNINQTHRFSSIAPSVIELMDDKNVSDTDLEKLINIALSLLQPHNLTVMTSQINISLREEENDKWFYYGIPISQKLSVEEIVELDCELADSMAEKELSPMLSAYFVTFFEVRDN